MVKKIIILIAFLGLYPSLKAYHSEKSYNIGNTAYTLKDSEMLLGLSSFRYGWSDNFQMETYYLPWFINAFNLGFKYKWQLSEKDFLALNLYVINLDFKHIDPKAEGTKVIVGSLDILYSYKLNKDISLSSGLHFSSVEFENKESTSDLRGAAAVSNLQFSAQLDWNLSKVTRLTLGLRVLMDQFLEGEARSVTQIDDFTKFEFFAKAHSDKLNFGNAWLISGTSHFSWSSFNFAIRGNYGNYNIPLVNFVIPKKVFIPEVWLYFLW